jgi:hypothetical protein
MFCCQTLLQLSCSIVAPLFSKGLKMVLVHAHSYTGTCFVNLLLFEKFCHMVFTSYNSFISQILEFPWILPDKTRMWHVTWTYFFTLHVIWNGDGSHIDVARVTKLSILYYMVYRSTNAPFSASNLNILWLTRTCWKFSQNLTEQTYNVCQNFTSAIAFNLNAQVNLSTAASNWQPINRHLYKSIWASRIRYIYGPNFSSRIRPSWH